MAFRPRVYPRRTGGRWRGDSGEPGYAARWRIARDGRGRATHHAAASLRPGYPDPPVPRGRRLPFPPHPAVEEPGKGRTAGWEAPTNRPASGARPGSDPDRAANLRGRPRRGGHAPRLEALHHRRTPASGRPPARLRRAPPQHGRAPAPVPTAPDL